MHGDAKPWFAYKIKPIILRKLWRVAKGSDDHLYGHALRNPPPDFFASYSILSNLANMFIAW
jgi:hypothetical protein